MIKIRFSLHSFSLSLSVLFVLAVILLVCGCGSNGGGQMSYNFKQGYSELQISLVPNAPPEKIYPFSLFLIVVNLDNQAAYDLTNGQVSIVGLDKKYFEIQGSLFQTFGKLEGRSLLNPAGQQQMLTFKGKSGSLVDGGEYYNANYFLRVSYDSTFEFTDTLCINPSFYDVYDSGCKEGDSKSYSGQGAPVAVTDIEKVVYSQEGGTNSEVEFRMTISNQGRGKVGKVSVKEARLGGEPIDCSFIAEMNSVNYGYSQTKQDLLSQKFVEFKPGTEEAMLFCTAKITQSKSYTTTLFVTFGYDYLVEQMNSINLVW